MAEGRLKELLLMIFVSNGLSMNEAKERIIIYYNLLKEDEQKAINGLNILIKTWIPSYGNKIPSVAEILKAGSKKSTMTWEYFKKNMCNNYKYEPIPADVDRIKKLLGTSACENMTEATERLLIKEFNKILEDDDTKHLTGGNHGLLSGM